MANTPMNRRTASRIVLIASLTTPARGEGGPEILFADFEGPNYAPWVATGTAFGEGPAAGTLPGQMAVTGFRGKRLVSSFSGGDGSTGTLTSPSFRVERRHLGFLIGGGGFEGKTCLNLLVDGRVVRSATGPNTRPGGCEALEPASWDLGDLLGKTASLRVVDEATGGWGHISIDHIVFTDRPPPATVVNPAREIIAEKRFLLLPVKNGAKGRTVSVEVGNRPVRQFVIGLADGAPDWWASLDISSWRGRRLTIRADRLPGDSSALASMDQGDAIRGADDLYREALRPQFHFSARRGWINDPNGLVCLDGEYHLFFQHNPYGLDWGNMHWGHAVSRDLFRWEELGEALYPDALGPMFSGSAVVDWRNTGGFGAGDGPPLVLIYTAAGPAAVQCLASSVDRGRTWTKYDGNPVLGQISGGNRDPKVFWHGPTRRWVMALYVERAGTQTIQFLTAPDLRTWSEAGRAEGFYECPDLFELPVDGGEGGRKWVLTAASGDYRVGSFDGAGFTPESPKLRGHHGREFYAAQTFSDVPEADGRRIQIGWLRAPSPGMPFNQAMSVPMELSLLRTPEGPRLARRPAREVESLRARTHHSGPFPLPPGEDPLAGVSAELIDLRITFDPGGAMEVGLKVRGIPISYDARTREVVVNGRRAPAPSRHGRQDLTILLDRTTLEVFASDGQTYVPMAVIPKAEDRSMGLHAVGGTARVESLDVHELRPAWPTVR